MITSKLTSQGRVTIPKQIRERLGLKPGDWVRFGIQEGKLVMQRTTPTFEESRGAIKPRHRPEDFEAVRTEARNKMAKRRAKGTESDSRGGQ